MESTGTSFQSPQDYPRNHSKENERSGTVCALTHFTLKTHRNLTQVTEIRRLGRGQSIGPRCDKSNAPPPQVSEASSLNQPFNVVNVGGLTDTHRHGHSKLRRGRIGFIAPS